MIFDSNRTNYRTFFFSCWKKYLTQQPLEPLEQQLVTIIQNHPQYHELLNQPEQFLEKNYLAMDEVNPFLHLALHQALLEQISTNRPQGIIEVYQSLSEKTGNNHTAEHIMMKVLTQFISYSQNNSSCSENDYLAALHHAKEVTVYNIA